MKRSLASPNGGDHKQVTERERNKRKIAVLPTFIVGGAFRSGTTSIYQWLRQDERVYMPSIKETNFFTGYRSPPTGPEDVHVLTGEELRSSALGRQVLGAGIVPTWEQYVELFQQGAAHQHRGEASPAYLYSRTAAEEIARAIPGCKIVLVLRNPADRAYSSWRFLTAAGRETLSFVQALAQETSRLDEGWEYIWALRGASMYSDAVARFLGAFEPSRVRIWLHERVTRDPASFYRELEAFLGMHGSFSPRFTKENSWYESFPRSQLWNVAANTGRLLVGRDRAQSIRRRIRQAPMIEELPDRLREQLLREFTEDISALDSLVPGLEASKEWLYPTVPHLPRSAAPTR